MGEKINVLISAEEVEKKICELAAAINNDYKGREIHLICILKGGVYFLTELSKHIKEICTVDFMTVSSYGNATTSTGTVKIKKDLEMSIEGRDVLVVEDIIDSGRTMAYLLEVLKNRGTKSVKLCALLDKPSRREVEVAIDYVGFQIPDTFIVGYGLDYQQKYRNLPFIGSVEL